jgi:hypothetical protein
MALSEAAPAKAEAEARLDDEATASAERKAGPAADRYADAPSAAKRSAPPPRAGEARAAKARDEEDAARTEVRTFTGCAGESRREIGRDAGGRVVRYAREGVAGGRRVRVELRFAGDGSLASARARDLGSGEPLPADALPGLPRSAAQVDPRAPPRCGP